MLAPEHAGKIVPGGNGVFAPMVVEDGMIVGTWKRTVKRDGVHVIVSPFEGRGPAEAPIVGEPRRYADFLGVPLAGASIQLDP